MIFAIDANFRLKMKERGVQGDTELGSGWAYMVNEKEYQAELLKHKDDPVEVSVIKILIALANCSY